MSLIKQVKHDIVAPTLAAINLGGIDAVNIVTGIANKESGFRAIAQDGGGPARSFWQVEPVTEMDQWHTFLNYPQHAALAQSIRQFLAPGLTSPQLLWNAAYACAICRVKLYRSPMRIPQAANDMAHVWKRVYNSALGAGEVTNEVVDLFQEAIDA